MTTLIPLLLAGAMTAVSAEDPMARAGAPSATSVLAQSAAPPAPDPAPGGHMTRVVMRSVTPGTPRDSFAAKPKTLYRLGEKYARIEEEPDPARGIHGLIVVAEPLVWMVNLASMTGQRIVDPGPTFVFHASILGPSPEGAEAPEIELGLEYEFLRSHGARRKEIVVGGRKLDSLVATVDGHVITLQGVPGADRPVRLKIERKGKTLAELEYLEYQRDLPPRMELFVPPAGVQMRDAQ